VKGAGFDQRVVVVREGEDGRDRLVMLPRAVAGPPQA
jgi:hypothetical protein